MLHFRLDIQAAFAGRLRALNWTGKIRKAMKVFISWSGDKSKEIASVFKDWIPAVIQAVKPYFSPNDIDKGARWSNEIAKELEASRIGIICLTDDNLQAPWLMFEAGALSKSMEKTRVCPILFGVEPTDLAGPLVQFQAAPFSKDEIHKVIKTINSQLGDVALELTVVDSVFEKWWPDLEEKVTKILNKERKTSGSELRSDRELLEEVLKISRTLYVRDREVTGRNSRLPVSRMGSIEVAERYMNLVSEILKRYSDADFLLLVADHFNTSMKLLSRNLPEEIADRMASEWDSVSRALETAIKEYQEIPF